MDVNKRGEIDYFRNCSRISPKEIWKINLDTKEHEIFIFNDLYQEDVGKAKILLDTYLEKEIERCLCI